MTYQIKESKVSYFLILLLLVYVQKEMRNHIFNVEKSVTFVKFRIFTALGVPWLLKNYFVIHCPLSINEVSIKS